MIGCLQTRVRKQPIIDFILSLRLYSSFITSGPDHSVGPDHGPGYQQMTLKVLQAKIKPHLSQHMRFCYLSHCQMCRLSGVIPAQLHKVWVKMKAQTKMLTSSPAGCIIMAILKEAFAHIL